MRNSCLLLKIIILFFASVSCQQDSGEDEFTDYSIIGIVHGETLEYQQTIFDSDQSDGINTFTRAGNMLYLHVFRNGTDNTKGYWSIRINGVDIEHQPLPYTLTGAEGSITWVDESVRGLQEPCESPDAQCFYSGAGVDEVNITIQSISDRTITGTFNGRLNHIQLYPTLIRDTNDYVEIFDGRFNMRFQIQNVANQMQ